MTLALPRPKRTVADRAARILALALRLQAIAPARYGPQDALRELGLPVRTFRRYLRTLRRAGAEIDGGHRAIPGARWLGFRVSAVEHWTGA